MGTVLGILGESGDPELNVRLQRILDASPHRGEATIHREDGLLLAIQSLGWDASVGQSSRSVVAIHGFVGNLDEMTDCQLTEGTKNLAEVLARLYDRDGEALFARLRGEFAVLLYDRQKRQLLAARDVIGCRSLFCGQDGETTVLATEARQVLAGSGKPPELDEDTLLAYLVSHVPADTATLFKGVGNLLPGKVWSMSTGKSQRAWTSSPYWHPRPDPALQRLSPRDWTAELTRRIEVAVRRSLPECPFAVTLSGGLDSSTVWGHVVRLRTGGDRRAALGRPVSLVFPGRDCDESRWIGETLASTGDKGITVNGDERPTRDYFDVVGPRLDTLQFSTTHFVHMICGAAAQSGCRVLLSGFFGDHWFDVRRPVGIRAMARQAIIAGSLAAFGQRAGATLISALIQTRQLMSGRKPAWLTPKARRRLWKSGSAEAYAGRSLAERSLRSTLWFTQRSWSVHGWDQVCAINGAESRHPFADLDLLELVLTLPRVFQESNRSKEALRAAGMEVLIESVRDRRDATSFDELCRPQEQVPQADWADTNWSLVRRGLIDRGGLDSLMETVYNQDKEAIWLMWLYLFELFTRRFEPIEAREE